MTAFTSPANRVSTSFHPLYIGAAVMTFRGYEK